MTLSINMTIGSIYSVSVFLVPNNKMYYPHNIEIDCTLPTYTECMYYYDNYQENLIFFCC